MSEWDLRSVEQAFAEAAVDPALLPHAMKVASKGTRSTGSLLFSDPNPGASGILPIFPHTPSMVSALEAYVADGWWQRDVRLALWSELVRKSIVTDFDAMNADEMKRHPYYQEFLAPHRLAWFAGVLVSNGQDDWSLSIQRSIAQGPFSSHETEQLAELSQRLGGAAALARALGFAAMEAALEAYELSGLGVAVIGRSGEVIRLNSSGERLLGHGIGVQRQRLVAETPAATRALERALHTLICADTGVALMAPVSLPRRDRLPLLAYPVKLSRLAGNLFFDGQVLVVFVDPETRERPPEAILQRTWGLTPAEARLASRLRPAKASRRSPRNCAYLQPLPVNSLAMSLPRPEPTGKAN